LNDFVVQVAVWFVLLNVFGFRQTFFGGLPRHRISGRCTLRNAEFRKNVFCGIKIAENVVVVVV